MIDDMTLAEAGDIFRYWEQCPPPHLMLQAIARFLGWQPARSATAAPPNAALADLAATPPPGLAVTPAAAIDMPPAVFDLATLRARNRTRAKAQG